MGQLGSGNWNNNKTCPIVASVLLNLVLKCVFATDQLSVQNTVGAGGWRAGGGDERVLLTCQRISFSKITDVCLYTSHILTQQTPKKAQMMSDAYISTRKHLSITI